MRVLGKMRYTTTYKPRFVPKYPDIYTESKTILHFQAQLPLERAQWPQRPAELPGWPAVQAARAGRGHPRIPATALRRGPRWLSSLMLGLLNLDIDTVMDTKYLPASKRFHFGTLVLKRLGNCYITPFMVHLNTLQYRGPNRRMKNPSINTEGCFQLSEFSSFEGCLRAHGWVKTTRVLGMENLF